MKKIILEHQKKQIVKTYYEHIYTAVEKSLLSTKLLAINSIEH